MAKVGVNRHIFVIDSIDRPTVRVQSRLSKLRITLRFGETPGAFTDLLHDRFKSLQLFRRNVLKHPFDECRVPAKERNKHLPSFFR